ncbi:nitrous oxide reductase family maturation protein NosD [Cytophagales bacterium LB-30]|uniref:Nitrous oxide reductase family maturation protein NosD n=1 Tax=Shiella aurantiaca TaxID=3058365 RepID=A0ABT8F3T1_9BACT|nr:nitrous oxide reductase family maturation protein NosD [Shiella aurantiaca]MDN4165019.1 nitrous oxide reductase family maturation protein NosD [Shiella aurantiaca]
MRNRCVGVVFYVSALFLLLSSGAMAKEWKLSPKQSIAEVVEQAQAGDTLRFVAGVYKQANIIIQKPLVLLGEKGAVLDGSHQHEILVLAAEHITVQGLSFQHSGRSSLNDLAAIKCLDAHYVRIINNQFDNTFFGIHLSNSNYALIEGNTLKAQALNEYELGNGIHLWKCKNARIVKNTITGHRDGIYFEFVTHSTIQENISTKNMRYGLHFMFSNDDEYLNNTFKNNGAGVSVMYSHGVSMHGNRFEENWGESSYGLLLKDIRDSEVIDNQFLANTSGIYMEGCSRTQFHGNEFKNNGWAIQLQASCNDNTLERNNFQGNSFDVVTNGVVVLNTLKNNYWDKYQGYDLDKDGLGDVPFRPVNMFSTVMERVPAAIVLWRSMLVFLLDRAEKVIPAMTPENLMDNQPRMKPYDYN